jgi:DNA (cytosine-5)-methyltransferase 1
MNETWPHVKLASIPVIDLFAGPGGLGEGFSSIRNSDGGKVFDIRLSIEKDPVAHRTLSLRALFRSFEKDEVPDAYYDYVRGDITLPQLMSSHQITEDAKAAYGHAKKATLGEIQPSEVDGWIRDAIGDANPWILIGGPPCQAYSLAGRSRMRGVDPKAFEDDKRHFLYKEYLRIISDFGPSVFVMENVKGILSSTHGGSGIFEQIISDLSNPGNDLQYEIRSFATGGIGPAASYRDYILESEKYGIPQMRHRVILFGVRRDLGKYEHRPLSINTDHSNTVSNALSGLPKLRGRISRETDSQDAWLSALKEASRQLTGWKTNARDLVEARMRDAYQTAFHRISTGGSFIQGNIETSTRLDEALRSWYHDDRLGGVLHHQTRSHMRSDLHRYLFCASYAAEFGISPKIEQFPPLLLPDHGNVDDEHVPFSDRFRVQLRNLPSTTVVSHISKDGHYYIHHDPSQCRSLTVREAARLQTFPDNYFFEGNRTEQYVQVGNAVPPYLAKQIAEVVAEFLTKSRASSS